MTIYEVPPITIPQGDCVPVQFSFVYSDKTIPDFSNYKCYYVLSPYGFEDENALSKEMNLAPGTTNVFRAALSSEDTQNLLGTYTVKIVLEREGNYYKKARGVFNVLKDSNGIEVTM